MSETIEDFRRRIGLERVVLVVHDTRGLIGLRWPRLPSWFGPTLERVTVIVEGLGGDERQRVAALRSTGEFFWIDVSLSNETGFADLGEALDVPERVLQALRFGERRTASRDFYADGWYVAFPFSGYIESTADSGERTYRTHPVEVHVLVASGYVLTVHEERASLPALLDAHPPEGGTSQYVVYAVLEAMIASAFDAVNEVEDMLDGLAVSSAGLRGGRLRMATLRAITARIARMRREVGPERALFERIGVEIERLRGFEADEERYFDRLAEQVDRLVNAIEADSDLMATLIELRLNETSYSLTVVATIFLPLTFLTGFFGMNFDWMVEQVDTALAFWLLGVGGCVVSALVVWRLLLRAQPVEDEPEEPRHRAEPS